MKKFDVQYICVTLLLVFIIGVCGYLSFVTIKLKVVDVKNYKDKYGMNRDDDVAVPARRGDVLARDGRRLACSMPVHYIAMDPCADGLKDSAFNNNIDLLCRQLSSALGDKSAAEYKSTLVKARKSGRRYVRLTPRPVSHADYLQIRNFVLFNRGRNKGGFSVETKDVRKQPFGLLANRTIGRLGDDGKPTVGIELAYDEVLSGKEGKGKRCYVGGRKQTITTVEPQDGCDVVSSIDVDIQDVAEYSLMRQLQTHNADHGVAILMEVRTGFVRAIVNLHRGEDGSYREDYNYAVGESAEPGSTFKLATMMACLEDGLVVAEDTIDTYDGSFQIHDRVMRDSHPVGNVDMKTAFAVSSNIAFARLVMRCYGRDQQRFVDRLRDLGLCDSLCLEIRGERGTFLKNPTDKSWSGTTLPWMSTGYEVQITPLQLLTFYNAVANGGTMMRPLFVERIERDGKTVKSFRPHVMRNSIASRRTITTVQGMLKEVVENGTAKNIRDTPYKIAGKTGTAQIANKGSYGNQGQRQYLASFAGYFPADDPLYSCVVMVYGPSGDVYYGNKVAGSVVKAIADRVYAAEFRKGTGKYQSAPLSSGKMPRSKAGAIADVSRVFSDLRIPHTSFPLSSDWISTTAEEDKVAVRGLYFSDGVVPDVTGLGAADVVTLLESRGLKVRLSGMGRVVNQWPAKGSPITNGGTVTVELGE